jgi:predicted dithiol-disulfide oxidoreductase (DUF899 family)
MNRPEVVTPQQWQSARDALLVKEKELTHALDALAAHRRRLPMVRLDKPYRFVAPNGAEVGLTELFGSRRQLVIYHFMLEPGQEELCGGCGSFTDNLAEHAQAHLWAHDTRLILMARAPQAEIEPVRRRMAWTGPWYSSHGSDFNDDLGLDGGFGLSVQLNDHGEVFRTYFTTARGVDRLRLDFNLLDLTPYGRQEAWEDSPAGWPRTSTMNWPRLRDEYERDEEK